MYASDFSTWVNEDLISIGLCGGSRPGHFRGVCTVVLKLLMIAQPTDAVFGRKDFQQCAVIARMVRDLDLPVNLHFAETVREPDGLALSSRNLYLNPEERLQATVLHQALQRARALVALGQRDPSEIRETIENIIKTAPLARVDYASIVAGDTLKQVETVAEGTVAALAVFFGKTRLIDNAQLL